MGNEMLNSLTAKLKHMEQRYQVAASGVSIVSAEVCQLLTCSVLSYFIICLLVWQYEQKHINHFILLTTEISVSI